MVRRLALSGAAVAVAVAAWWFGPMVLDVAGLGDFGFVPRFGLVILALSATETILARLRP